MDPAYSIEELYKEGADEVLFAVKGQTFSAFHEYEPEQIEGMTVQLHGKGMQSSVLMNRLYGEEDIKKAEEVMEQFIKAGVDSVQFADPGLLVRAVSLHGMDHMIYRPETLMTNERDAAWWNEQGISGVMISSLLTAGEIEEIASHTPHAGIVIHGRQLMSVSKRPLLLAYEKVCGEDMHLCSSMKVSLREDKRDGHMPVYENDRAMMVYSDYVQSSFNEMDGFIKSDIERYEIDTAWMSKEEVLSAVHAYHQILNGGSAESIGSEYRKKFAEIPLSDGYYGQKTIK